MLRSCNNPSCYLISYHTLKFLVENFSARHLHMYIQGGYKEDWATLHAYVFIVIDCIEICRTLFEKQKVLHASRYSIFLCVSRSLFRISFIFPSCCLLHFSISLFLSFSHSFSLSLSLTHSLARLLAHSQTQQIVQRGSRDIIMCFIYTMRWHITKFDIDYNNNNTLLLELHKHTFFFLLLLLFSSSSFFTPRPFHSHEKYNIQNIYHEGCMRHSWNYNFSYFHYLLLPPSLSLTLALTLSLTLTFSFLLYFTIFSFHFSILSIINIIIYIYISSHDFSFIFFSLLTLSSSLVPSHSRILLSMYN